MQRDFHNEVETLTIEDGSFIIQGRPSQRAGMQRKTLKSMVERVFRTQMEGKQIAEAVIQIGPSFKKELGPGDVEGFDSMLKQAMFDSGSLTFNEQGQMKTRLKLIAVY